MTCVFHVYTIQAFVEAGFVHAAGLPARITHPALFRILLFPIFYRFLNAGNRSFFLDLALLIGIRVTNKLELMPFGTVSSAALPYIGGS